LALREFLTQMPNDAITAPESGGKTASMASGKPLRIVDTSNEDILDLFSVSVEDI